MIMAKDNKYQMEQELMEAFTYAENAEIGMPDVESELLLVRKRASESTRSSSVFVRIASVAASVVVVFSLGWSIYSYIGHVDSSRDRNSMNFCVAYVAGERITDEQQVLDMMTEDIRNMNDEGDIIDSQLNVFFNE